jgi:phosphate/sulfate permease
VRLCTAWGRTLIVHRAVTDDRLVVGHVLMVLILWVFHRMSPRRVDHWFRRLQLVSAAFFSLNHGGNDAQKTRGSFPRCSSAPVTSAHSRAVVGQLPRMRRSDSERWPEAGA